MNSPITIDTYKLAAERTFSGAELEIIHSLLEGAHSVGFNDGLRRASEIHSEVVEENKQMQKINDRLFDPMTSRFGQSYTGEVGK